MDFNLLNLIWAVVVIPIGWFYNSYTKRAERINKLEIEVKSLKEKIDPLNSDIKLLTATIASAQLDIERRLYSIATGETKSKG